MLQNTYLVNALVAVEQSVVLPKAQENCCFFKSNAFQVFLLFSISLSVFMFSLLFSVINHCPPLLFLSYCFSDHIVCSHLACNMENACSWCKHEFTAKSTYHLDITWTYNKGHRVSPRYLFILLDEFSICRGPADISSFYAACVSDLCSSQLSNEQLCSSVEAYITICGESASIPSNWRENVPECGECDNIACLNIKSASQIFQQCINIQKLIVFILYFLFMITKTRINNTTWLNNFIQEKGWHFLYKHAIII